MSTLRVSVVSTSYINEYDDKLRSVFTNLLMFIKSENNNFDFTEIELLKLSYESEPYILNKNCIATLTPAKYLMSKKILLDKIIAIQAVKKVHQKLPYFSAFFIVDKNSEITSIYSDKIKRIFLVSGNSTSGYIAPLYKLWESGVIKTPNEHGIREKGWEMILVGNQRDVEMEVISDRAAIGATGQFKYQDEPENSFVIPLLRYYYLPQDVIVISSNMLPFKESIIKWLIKIFEKDDNNQFLHEEGQILSQSSTKITGVHKIDIEFKNSLRELQNMIKNVKSIPENNGNSLKVFKIFLASSEELKSDRDNFEIFMSRENNTFVKQGVYFQVIRWEYFLDAMSKDGLQSEYNKAIESCDIFVSLFFTKVGKYTEEEFEVAFGHFKESAKPIIYTYFKDAPITAEAITDNVFSLLKFRDKLKSLGHYRTIYKDTGDLLYQFKIQLQTFLKC